MYRNVAKFILAIVLIAGGAFSAANTFELFRGIFGSDLVGVLWSGAGLALFDLGALGWLLHFAHGAKGNVQRTVAALAGGACLLLTLIAAGTHVLLVQTLTAVPTWAGNVAMLAILAGLTINLLAAAANHMADPETLRQIREQQLSDERQDAIQRAQAGVFREALRQTEARVAATAGEVSEALSREFSEDARREMLALTANGVSLPLGPVMVTGPKPAKNGTHTYAAEAPAAPKAPPQED